MILNDSTTFFHQFSQKTILNDSTTIFIDFHKKNTDKQCVFLSFRIRRKHKYRFLQRKKRRPKKLKNRYCFLTFQIRRTRKYRFVLIKTRFLNTSLDPADPANPSDPAEMEHKLRLATHQQRAGGQDDVSLNKLPQMRRFRF